MRPPKQIGRFFVSVLVVYGILIAPLPGLRYAYATAFRAVANVAYARFPVWGDGSVHFMEIEGLKPGDLPPGAPPIVKTKTLDTVMELRSARARGSYGLLRMSARYVGYGPTVVLFALIISTAIPWRRRLRALAWGMLIVHGFILFRVTLILLSGGFAIASKPYALFSPGPFWSDVITKLDHVFSSDPTVSFIVPAVIWFFLALWKSDRFASDDEKSERASSTPAKS